MWRELKQYVTPTHMQPKKKQRTPSHGSFFPAALVHQRVLKISHDSVCVPGTRAVLSLRTLAGCRNSKARSSIGKRSLGQSPPTNTEYFRSGGQMTLIQGADAVSSFGMRSPMPWNVVGSPDNTTEAHVSLVDTSIALHGPLERSVVEHSGFCADEILVEQSSHEMELRTLTADNDHDHSFSFLRFLASRHCCTRPQSGEWSCALRLPRVEGHTIKRQSSAPTLRQSKKKNCKPQNPRSPGS